MYGLRRAPLAGGRLISGTAEGHVVFLERVARRRRTPLDLSPLGKGGAVGAPAAAVAGPELCGQADGFLRWLFKRAGLEAGAYNPTTLARRMPACLRYLKVANAGLARERLEAEPDLVSPALGMLLIGVTGFFRDRGVFEALERTVLPAIARGRTGAIRVWSAACSEGQELYSVAMLAAEGGMLRRCELVGSDCRPEATYRARLGVYDDGMVREMSAGRRQRFLSREAEGEWRVVEPLRKAVEWRMNDLMTCPEPGPWDLILCRNMAMYLKPTAAGPLWQELERGLRNGGYLVTGKAERPVGATRLVAVAPCVYRKEWA